MGQQNTRELLENFRPWLEILLNNLALLCTLSSPASSSSLHGRGSLNVKYAWLSSLLWLDILFAESTLAMEINNLRIANLSLPVSLCSFVCSHRRRNYRITCLVCAITRKTHAKNCLVQQSVRDKSTVETWSKCRETSLKRRCKTRKTFASGNIPRVILLSEQKCT